MTAGWFVVNARDAAWLTNEATHACCIFESDDFVLRDRPDLTKYVKPGAGFALRVLQPGRPIGYHAESVQEDFLVLMGECVLVCAGNRDPDDETHARVYPRSDVARRYGASVDEDTTSDAEADATIRSRDEHPEGWSELPWSPDSG